MKQQFRPMPGYQQSDNAGRGASQPQQFKPIVNFLLPGDSEQGDLQPPPPQPQLKREIVEVQDTVRLPSQHKKSVSSLAERVLHRLPGPAQHIGMAMLNRIRDPHPEEGYGEKPFNTQAFSCGWLPGLTLCTTLGVLSIAYAFSVARTGQPGLEIFFLLGLLLIFTPATIRLLSAEPTRFERIVIVCITGICLYIIKVQSSPLYFSFFDEFLHWRTADDIARTGHLYTNNALLPVSAYYPGLEIVTNALSSLSLLNTFYSGLVVIGMARLVMVLSLYMLNEQLLNSPRMAGLATIIYMGNPHFLLFDAQYAYESLALPLVTFVLCAMAPHQVVSLRLNRLEPVAPIVMFSKARHKWLRSDLRWITIITLFVLVAIAFTHHVTDFVLDGMIILWSMAYAFMRLAPLYRSYLARIALVGVLLSLIVIAIPGNPVVEYITSFMSIALNELGHIVTGTSSAKPLFRSYTGNPTPLWERTLTITSQLLVLLGLPLGLLCLWQRFRKNALSCTFGLLALCYPLVQVFRFTTAGSELVDRSAAFLFIPISTVLAIVITQFWPTYRLRWKQKFSISAVLVVMAIGGIVLGAGPSMALLPGTYMVSADSRSIEPEGIQAAIWVHDYLGTNNRLATDRINQILMGTYGQQRIVSSIEDKVDMSPIFLSPTLGPSELSILKSAQIHYLVADMRVTKSLPLLGFYYEEGEPGAFEHKSPVDPHVLEKLNAIGQINKIFDSGNIIIYDTGGLINAPEKL